MESCLQTFKRFSIFSHRSTSLHSHSRTDSSAEMTNEWWCMHLFYLVSHLS